MNFKTIYLCAKYSIQSNTRSDEYSSHPDNALRLLRRVVFAVREVVPKTFILGIKMNAADYVEPENKIASPLTTKEDDRVLDHVREIASWGAVDFIEISGGDYENPGTCLTYSTLVRILLDLSQIS